MQVWLAYNKSVESDEFVDIRRLRDLVDMIGAAVYYSSLAQTSYEQLGLTAKWPRSGSIEFESEGYFCSRCVLLANLGIPQISDALQIFPIDVVSNSLNSGWAKASVGDVKLARETSASAQLQQTANPSFNPNQCADFLIFLVNQLESNGLALFDALKEDPIPSEPFARLWRASDLLREYRAGNHLRVSAAELTPTELLVITFASRDRDPFGSLRGLGWSIDSTTDTISELNRRGLLKGVSITDSGKRLRSHIEVRTDESQNNITRFFKKAGTDSIMDQLNELTHNLTLGDLSSRRRISDY